MQRKTKHCRTHFGFYQRFSGQEELALRVLILGFPSLQEVSSTMGKLIKESQYFAAGPIMLHMTRHKKQELRCRFRKLRLRKDC